MALEVEGIVDGSDHETFCRIKHLPLAAVEAVACKYLLRSPRGHLGKNYSPTGQSQIWRPHQVENVITIRESART
jgi:hypothetical protein